MVLDRQSGAMRDITDGLDQTARMELEAKAIKVILSREQHWRQTPTHNPGYDLYLRTPELLQNFVLRLTRADDVQAEQFSSILSEQHDKYRAMGRELRDQGVARDSDEARALRKAAHEETRQRLSAVLSADQLEQFEEMHRNRKGRGHGHGKHWKGDSEEL